MKTADQHAGDELKKYLAENGPKATTALGTVASISARLPAPTGKVDLQGLKGDALVVHKEDLGDLENPKKLRVPRNDPFRRGHLRLEPRAAGKDKGEYLGRVP